MSLIQRLRSLWRTRSLSASERQRAARLGVYFIEAEGFDRAERAMFIRTVAVCLNPAEARQRLQSPPREAHWEDVEYKCRGPLPLLTLFDLHAISVDAVRSLLQRAAKGEAHELLPEPLTPAELRQAESVEVHLIWYEDKFHYGIERDSFAISVCLSREEAEAEYKSRGRQAAEPAGDGYEIVGPSPLRNQPPVVVREVLRRLQAGESGPVPIPSIYRR